VNETIKYYNNHAESISKRYEVADVSVVQKLLLEVFPENSYLLDIGCGSGRDASFMMENGYKIVGIDASYNMIQEAKKLHPKLEDLLQVVNIPDNLDFKDNSFEGVYSIATLMHLDKNKIDLSITKIYNCLKNDGKFLFSVPILRTDLNQDNYDEKGRYFTIMDQSEWLDICYSKGFKKIKILISNDGLNRKGIKWLTCVLWKKK
jgi:SAM-dependent methyltransferase